MGKETQLLQQQHWIREILAERKRQTKKWGTDPTRLNTDNFARVAGEEFGEICRAINEKDDENLIEEVVQLGALCLAFLESIGGSVLERQEKEAEKEAAKNLSHREPEESEDPDSGQQPS